MKNRLRVFRAEYRWSQAEVAERLGVSRQAINAVETGKYEPSLTLAFKLARLFGARIEDLFQPDDAEYELARQK
jgi:putative transcriptional regulator